MKSRLILIVFSLWCCNISVAAEPIFSGPQPGEKLTPLVVRGVYGDEAGKEIDLAGQAKGNPLVLIFFHERTRPAFGLMNAITRFTTTRAKDGLVTGVCFLTDDPTSTQTWLKRGMARYFGKGATYGVSGDGIEGPGSYGLNRNVALTVLVAKNNQVTANFALVQPSVQADGPTIFKEIVAVLGGGDVPDVSEFANYRAGDTAMRDRKLQQMLNDLRKQGDDADEVKASAAKIEEYVKTRTAARQFLGQTAARLVRSGDFGELSKPVQAQVREWARKFGRQMRERTASGRRGAQEEQDPNLRPLLVPLIQKTASPAEVDKAAKAVEEYIAEHDKARHQVGQIARRIIDAGRLANYGTPRAQEYLTKWAKDYGLIEEDEKRR